MPVGVIDFSEGQSRIEWNEPITFGAPGARTAMEALEAEGKRPSSEDFGKSVLESVVSHGPGLREELILWQYLRQAADILNNHPQLLAGRDGGVDFDEQTQITQIIDWGQRVAGHYVDPVIPATIILKLIKMLRDAVASGSFDAQGLTLAGLLRPTTGPRAELRVAVGAAIEQDLAGFAQNGQPIGVGQNGSQIMAAFTKIEQEAAADIRFGADLSGAETRGMSATVIVAILAGKIFDLKIGAARAATALKELVTFFARTSPSDRAKLFTEKYSNASLPVGALRGLALDVLEESPSVEKWDAVEAVLALNEYQHHGFILLGKPDAMFWARFRAMPAEMQRRLHVKSISGAQMEPDLLVRLVRSAAEKMSQGVQRTQAYRGTGTETFVITAPGVFVQGFDGKLNAAVLNADDVKEKAALDGVGTAAATFLSQDLLLGGGEKLSEKTSHVIQKQGGHYAFIPSSLAQLQTQLRAENRGLLSIRQAA